MKEASSSSKESLSLSLSLSSSNARVLHAQTVLFGGGGVDERFYEKGVVVVPCSSSVFDDVIFI